MLQGARHSHISALEDASKRSGISIEVHELRKASDLISAEPQAIIIPGGESTTMRLTGNSESSGLMPELFKWIREDKSRAVLGTCAGAIILSNPMDGGPSLVDASIDRNAFGPQSESFQCAISSSLLGREFPGVFIRAPRFSEVGGDAKIIATADKDVVGVKTGNRLALTFHPELSSDSGFHEWLLKAANESSGVST